MCDTYMCSGKSSVFQQDWDLAAKTKRFFLTKENGLCRRDCIQWWSLLLVDFSQNKCFIIMQYTAIINHFKRKGWYDIQVRHGAIPPLKLQPVSMYYLSLIE